MIVLRTYSGIISYHIQYERKTNVNMEKTSGDFIKTEREIFRVGCTHKTGKEIAYELGFETPSYFYEVFRQHEGISPSTYREENLGDRNPHR